MVQPKYSPEEALQRIKLMMEYDSSKTLDENKEVISEQYVAPAAVGTAVGAAAGAGLGATGVLGAVGTQLPAIYGATALAAAEGTGVAGVLGTSLGISAASAGAIVGGAAALAVLPLVYWLVTKDDGMGKVKKIFEMCSSNSVNIAKLPRKLQDTDLRSMTDSIEDALVNDSYGFQGGTDEEKLFGTFKKLESGTASDFCALVKYYNKNSDSGDLFDDLDSDIDSESEWKQIYRPIRNCVEDSLLSIKDVAPVKTGDSKKKKVGGGYKPCSGTYSFGCKSNAIAKVQGCLGLTTDGKFGKLTKSALSGKGFTSFTDADITKICNKPIVPSVEPEVSGEDVSLDPSNTNF
jgi:hypothetical protein